MSRTRVFSALRKYFRIVFAAEKLGLRPEALESISREPLMSRREFLHGVLRTAAGTALAATTAAAGLGALGCQSEPAATANGNANASPNAPKRNSSGDNAADAGPTPAPNGPVVAIVGGGMGGLHCAYRLKRGGLRATVYEAASRTGGRMFSARGKFPNSQVVELGGELIDTGHATIRALAEEFGVPLDDLHTEPATITTDTFFIRGQRVSTDALLAEFGPLAKKLAAASKATEIDPAELARLDRTSLAEWLDHEASAGETVKRIIIEAYVGELGLEADQISVLSLLWQIGHDDETAFELFGESDERFHVRGGNDTLVQKLAEQLPGQIELEHRLVALAARPTGGYTLTFEHGAHVHEIAADYVVLALPFTLLRRVELKLDLPAAKRQAIQELGYGTNAKLMSGYSSRVWREVHHASGSTVADDTLQTVWETSRGQAGATGILTNFVGGNVGLTTFGQSDLDALMAARLDLIDRVYPGTKAAYLPRSAVRMHWPTAPTALGSYACFKPGQYALQPSVGSRVGQVLFCGEHTSAEHQGFMEGACETGAQVAREILAEVLKK